VAQVKRRNDAIAHVALSLKAFPEAERPPNCSAGRARSHPLRHRPRMLTSADLSDRGWLAYREARDLENIIKDAKPDLMAVPAGQQP
jgi:hypothetical protein